MAKNQSKIQLVSTCCPKSDDNLPECPGYLGRFDVILFLDKNGWPKLDEFMGRFIFILWDMDGKTTKVREMYSQNTDGLKGRLFFTSFYAYEKENHDESMFGKSGHG